MEILLVVLFTTIFLSRVSLAGKHEDRLVTWLLGKYESLERPVAVESEPLTIKFGLALQQIIDVDEKNQLITTNIWLDLAWKDTNLQWEPTKFNNITSIRIPPSKLWKPDILMYNSADETFDATYQTNYVVFHNGEISYVPPGLFKSTCKIDIRWFPFDEQFCKMKFGSWTYDGKFIILLNKSDSANLAGFSKNGEWDLKGMPSVQHEVFYDCCPDTPYYDVTFTLHIKRRVLYYAFNLIIPCVLISSMALLTFTLPPDAGEKIGLGVTILLSLTVFMLLVADKLPETSESIPLIGMYFICIMAMCSVSVMFTVLVLNFHHRNPDTHKMSALLKKCICEWLPWVLRMKRPGRPNFNREEYLERQKTMALVKKIDDDLCNTLHRDTVNDKKSQQSALPNYPSAVRLSAQNPDSSQSQPSEASASSYCSRSDLQIIYRELKYITDRYRDEDSSGEEASDWVFAAMVIDRLCLYVFFIFTIVSTCAILLSAPNVFGQTETKSAS